MQINVNHFKTIKIADDKKIFTLPKISRGVWNFFFNFLFCLRNIVALVASLEPFYPCGGLMNE
jgi:hypothetical protein